MQDDVHLPTARLTKKDVGYVNYPNGKERCGVCDMYRYGLCTLVKGVIMAWGYCNEFYKKGDKF